MDLLRKIVRALIGRNLHRAKVDPDRVSDVMSADQLSRVRRPFDKRI